MPKQLSMKHAYHRCQKCGREIRSKKSISKGMGKKCEKRLQAFLKGLRELAARENT